MKIIHIAFVVSLGACFALSAAGQQSDTTATAAVATASPVASLTPNNAKQIEKRERRRQHRQEHRRRFGGNNRGGTPEERAERQANRQQRREMRGKVGHGQTRSQERRKLENATPSPN